MFTSFSVWLCVYCCRVDSFPGGLCDFACSPEPQNCEPSMSRCFFIAQRHVGFCRVRQRQKWRLQRRSREWHGKCWYASELWAISLRGACFGQRISSVRPGGLLWIEACSWYRLCHMRSTDVLHVQFSALHPYNLGFELCKLPVTYRQEPFASASAPSLSGSPGKALRNSRPKQDRGDFANLDQLCFGSSHAGIWQWVVA